MEEDQEKAPAGEIADLVIAGRKIEAIKRVRETTGADLTEAKRVVDQLQADLAAAHPHLAPRPKSGCSTSAALLAFATLGAFLVLALRVIE